MERLQRASVLLTLNEELRKAGSWAGETHMQKAVFFLQELMNIPLDFDFVLYKHGPFSFDLRDELTFMRAQGYFRLEPQYPYGPTLVGGEKSELLRRNKSPGNRGVHSKNSVCLTKTWKQNSRRIRENRHGSLYQIAGAR